MNWVWPGRDRRRLCIFYDDEKMSYVGMTEKADPGDLTGKRKRVVGVRARSWAGSANTTCTSLSMRR